MIYKGRDLKLLKPEMKVWACAYNFDTNKTTMNLKQEPVYGILKPSNFKYKTGSTTDVAFFVPFKKGSDTELSTTRAIRSTSRVYADSYHECVELYNSLVQERADWFQTRKEETEMDLL